MTKRELQQQDIIHLLKRWKEGDRHYPERLKEKRRAEFLALLPVFHPHSKPSGQAGHAGHSANLPMSLPMQILLGALSVAILILGAVAGNTIVQNWDTLVNYLQGGIAPTASSTHPTALHSPSPSDQLTATPLATGTPSPTLPASALTTAPPPPDAGATSQASPTNPGNHYGQTKTPHPKPNQRP